MRAASKSLGRAIIRVPDDAADAADPSFTADASFTPDASLTSDVSLISDDATVGVAAILLFSKKQCRDVVCDLPVIECLLIFNKCYIMAEEFLQTPPLLQAEEMP